MSREEEPRVLDKGLDKKSRALCLQELPYFLPCSGSGERARQMRMQREFTVTKSGQKTQPSD